VLVQTKWNHSGTCTSIVLYSRIGCYMLLIICVVLEQYLFPWQTRMPNFTSTRASRQLDRSDSGDVFEDDDELLPLDNYVPMSSVVGYHYRDSVLLVVSEQSQLYVNNISHIFSANDYSDLGRYGENIIEVFYI
jgi:hypothetical protein